MKNIKIKSFKEVLKEEFSNCKTENDKWNKVIDLFASQTTLLEIIINNLSSDLQRKILTDAGFKEIILN